MNKNEARSEIERSLSILHREFDKTDKSVIEDVGQQLVDVLNSDKGIEAIIALVDRINTLKKRERRYIILKLLEGTLTMITLGGMSQNPIDGKEEDWKEALAEQLVGEEQVKGYI